MRPIRAYMGGLGNNLFQYAYLYSQVRNGKLPDIYLQDYKHFDKYKQELTDILSIDVVKSDYISLHIRRGDYVNNPFYIDLTKTDYYDKAIAMFPDEKFLVFCADRQGNNDIEDQIWCMEWLKSKYKDKIQLFKGWRGNEIEDMNNMIGCKGHIMANSSFSFWASYIGGGKTVAPKEWFANGTSIPLPDNFIVI